MESVDILQVKIEAKTIPFQLHVRDFNWNELKLIRDKCLALASYKGDFRPRATSQELKTLAGVIKQLMKKYHDEKLPGGNLNRPANSLGVLP